MPSETPAIQIPQREVVREVMANGTVFLYAPNPYNPIVAMNILSRQASRHEQAEKAGMANLCMRLLSAGTDLHTEEEIAINLERNGALFKAEAGKDNSAVDLLSTTHFFQDDLQAVLELLDRPTFPEDKIERECEIVRMNILEQEDSLLTYTMRIFRKLFFGDHPYSWPNIGLVETLDNIERDDLVPFAQGVFEPSNLIVSVVGGSEKSGVREMISNAFADRPVNGYRSIPDPPPAAPAFVSNCEKVEQKESEAEYIVMGYPGCSIRDEIAIPMRLIGAILGGSMDSRLFREIRDKRGLCYQVGANFTPSHGHSPLMIYAVSSPQNRRDVISCAEAEIKRLQDESISEEELDRVKTYICGTNVMSMETVMGQASRFALYEAAGLGWEYANRFSEEIYKADAQTIQDVARKLLTHRLLTITAPPA
ncbi:MAG: pitrilysin family protein [Candidatus Omnitrophota bacterium]